MTARKLPEGLRYRFPKNAEKESQTFRKANWKPWSNSFVDSAKVKDLAAEELESKIFQEKGNTLEAENRFLGRRTPKRTGKRKDQLNDKGEANRSSRFWQSNRWERPSVKPIFNSPHGMLLKVRKIWVKNLNLRLRAVKVFWCRYVRPINYLFFFFSFFKNESWSTER